MKYWVFTSYFSDNSDIFDKIWDYDFNNGVLAVGWVQLGDLSKYIHNLSKEEFKNKYVEVYKKDSSINRVGIWKFYHELSIGDMIIARKGRKEILAIGKVVKAAYYDSQKANTRINGIIPEPEYKFANFIDVKWEEQHIKFDKQVFPIFTIWDISEDKYHSFIKREIPKDLLEKHSDSISSLIKKKKQIILYGPPGTGKTFNTKAVALNLLEGYDYVVDMLEYEDIAEEDIQENKNVDHPLFNKIEKFINSLAEIIEKPRTSMIGYYSFSKKVNKKIGLVWLTYPINKTSSFAVHLRKEDNKNKYPEEIVNKLSNYKQNGWGGYPEFSVKNDDDADLTIELIKYAYNNL